MRSQSNRLRPDGNAGHLNYVRVRSRFGPLYKIGFTKSESVARRFNFKNNGDEKMLDAQFLFAYHEDAFNLEKRLHEHFSAKKAFGNFASYEHLPLYKNGQSELYPFDILGIDPDDAFVEASRLPPDMRQDVGNVVRMYRREVTEKK